MSEENTGESGEGSSEGSAEECCEENNESSSTKNLEHILNSSELTRDDDCPFCELSKLAEGEENSRGSVVVYKTGDDPDTDWYIILQPTTASDKDSGMNLQVMPVGHAENFKEGGSKAPEYYRKMGIALGVASQAMNHALGTRGKDAAAQIIYGKAQTPENTQPHIHYKVMPFNGDVAQAWPSDAGWEKKAKHSTEEGEVVYANPVTKNKLDPDRKEYLTKTIRAYLS